MAASAALERVIFAHAHPSRSGRLFSRVNQADGDASSGHRAPAEVPAGFIGLSYETSELLGTRLSPGNTELVALCRRLGPEGVLRLGGNSSDRDRVHPSPAALSRLAGFLRATGWSLIYGLDLGNGTKAEAAAEAESVAEAAGAALIAFQIGNEPDIFTPILRPSGWSIPDYLAEWHGFAEAVRHRVPAARFAGPDIAGKGAWMMPFARHADPRPVLLTRHFYPEGPGDSPAVTIARLMASGGGLAEAMGWAERAASATGLPLRMTETNSVYLGGRFGVSDTLAAAAWGANLMFRLAAAGWVGVNFHTRAESAYTPLGAERDERPIARPLYYGMLLFAAARARRVSPAALRDCPAAVAAYAIEGARSHRRLALINMNPKRSARIALSPARGASLLRLTARSPAATSGVTLGGAEVANNGAWNLRPERLAANGVIDLPPCNAVLVTER
jgi:hypothetical protein